MNVGSMTITEYDILWNKCAAMLILLGAKKDQRFGYYELSTPKDIHIQVYRSYPKGFDLYIFTTKAQILGHHVEVRADIDSLMSKIHRIENGPASRTV